MTKLLAILFASVLVNNYTLVKFLGICPFLGVSKKVDQAAGMGIAVIFVMLVATAATWPIQTLFSASLPRPTSPKMQSPWPLWIPLSATKRTGTRRGRMRSARRKRGSSRWWTGSRTRNFSPLCMTSWK